jgi:agmatinase
VVEFICRLGKSGKKVVAADITELAKIPGTQVSEFTAARIAEKIFVHLV